MSDSEYKYKYITVGLIERTQKELAELKEMEQLEIADVVNRAISMYFLVRTHQREKFELGVSSAVNGNRTGSIVVKQIGFYPSRTILIKKVRLIEEYFNRHEWERPQSLRWRSSFRGVACVPP